MYCVQILAKYKWCSPGIPDCPIYTMFELCKSLSPSTRFVGFYLNHCGIIIVLRVKLPQIHLAFYICTSSLLLIEFLGTSLHTILGHLANESMIIGGRLYLVCTEKRIIGTIRNHVAQVKC